MSQVAPVIILTLIIAFMASFWRRLLLLLLSLAMAIFCLGLYHIVQFIQHG